MASKKKKPSLDSCIVDKKGSVIVVLDNIRSLHNVGAIFRTCDGAGVKKIYLCGMTGTPPRREITKTAIGAEDTVPWEYRRYTLRLVKKLREEGYQIVALEKNSQSEIFKKAKYRKKTCLIVGHEINGVKDSVLAQSDKIVHIPMYGIKESLNVATAFGIAVYEIASQLNDL
ncbi:RNA methyltransferase [Candidatus Peregrinibacteria bacterium CG22_combo_CG10-13_8_21_14_all_44_10]|nr:MAG: hypothetical protein AUK45_02825 [Candidatus Peregrinibacteria bacterium CG2_30_44_17]PIP66469.1 MAG: RNA methyltransferase [Candidatus Peregrinibacteria bacterium CG22_combo_CG10-13_8_21_14_all_44_10]PIS04344.1 MAG: RNA methyltransferase [Candidatus Peregrinibacteria bacterium CG10_big_fil_rev_8_21_14_0_10_44_7]PIX80159.1 MAG: RNA methyltransferase [Candidatus Peregrinibacteria bacterium CG_4_10_14_3_um_filter_44_21]PJB89513.1 MAG: RNA methyltransferase [Candidatus Peregrinibacteria ba